MKLEGRAEIHAPRAKVWAFVTDPGWVVGCAPGVQSIEKLSGGRFRAHARANVGFIGVKVVVDAEFTQTHEPDDATVVAHGEAAGSSVDATLELVLSDGEDGDAATVISWSAHVTLSGMIASMGAGLDETAGKAIGQVFDCARARLEA